ncbi:HK97 gp10 family phage protein [Bacillus sp. LL01]|uniref:HK97 gp10 family phage protein n=1 Tax=Bacillus sp. LL01 TaxID=1665556 RepID=UPI00069D0160|nr:HK97 gp10 family phage protein [Bacillus sp. LL01]
MNVKVTGLDQVIKKLGTQAAADLAKDLDGITEKSTLKMANEAAINAPRRDGHLKNSIVSSVKQRGLATWSYGSDREYAMRQEYEHPTQKGFFRKSIWNGRAIFRKDIVERIRKLGR